MKLSVATLSFLAIGSASALADPTLLGSWARGDGKAVVSIASCGSAVCAVNTWIRPGTNDEHVGDRLIMHVKEDGAAVYSGTASDPQRNQSYSLRIEVAEKSMTTHGCILLGLLCKSMGWKRAAQGQ